MIIKLRLLHQAEKLQSLLKQDGWELEQFEDGSHIAKHPEVTSERTARIRLYYLGLLTSGALRIDIMTVPCQTLPGFSGVK